MANTTKSVRANGCLCLLRRGVWLLLVVALTAVDVWTKQLAASHLKQSPVVLIDGVLELTYVENTGAAWSMLAGKQILLIVVTAVMMAVLLFALLSNKWRHPVLQTGEALLIAGGLGNLIDRVVRHYVVDFIYVSAIHFPVFNVADCCVCCGAALLLVYLLFLEEGKSRGNKASATDGNGGGTAGQNGSTSPLGDEGDGTKMD